MILTSILIIEKRCKPMAQSTKSTREMLSLKEISTKMHIDEAKELSKFVEYWLSFYLEMKSQI